MHTPAPPGLTVTEVTRGVVEEEEGSVGMYCGLSGLLHIPLRCNACFCLVLGATHSAGTGTFWAQLETWTEARCPHVATGTVPRSEGNGPLTSGLRGRRLLSGTRTVKPAGLWEGRAGVPRKGDMGRGVHRAVSGSFSDVPA